MLLAGRGRRGGGGAVAEAPAWRGRGVFGPEFEAAFDAEGGEEVGVDGGGEPLELLSVVLALWCGNWVAGTGAYLENLASVCSPVVAVPPDAVLVAVEDADLSVDRSCRAPVAIGVEGDGLNQVLVPVADEVEVGALINGRRRG